MDVIIRDGMGFRTRLAPAAAAAAATVLALSACGGSSTETAPRGDAAAGKRVFRSAGCGDCHSLKAAGTTGIAGGPLDLRPQQFDDVVERVREGGGGMPAFGKKLSREQIDDVAAFVARSTAR